MDITKKVNRATAIAVRKYAKKRAGINDYWATVYESYTVEEIVEVIGNAGEDFGSQAEANVKMYRFALKA